MRWQKIENVSHSMLKAWNKNWPSASNTGILTKHTPTLDADILNEPAAIAIEELVCERFEERGCILPRIGRAPKRALFFARHFHSQRSPQIWSPLMAAPAKN